MNVFFKYWIRLSERNRNHQRKQVLTGSLTIIRVLAFAETNQEKLGQNLTTHFNGLTVNDKLTIGFCYVHIILANNNS